MLAIAGLIFLMVFIALPALQRSQRDSLRKYHAKSLADAVTRYMTNNSRFSSMTSEEYNQTRVSSLIGYGYLKADEMLDPSTGEVYQLDEGSNGYRLYLNYQNIQPGFYGMDSGACVGNTPVDTGSEGLGVEGRSRVYVFGLENGGWVCTSNVMR